jgi:hypothetical protein
MTHLLRCHDVVPLLLLPSPERSEFGPSLDVTCSLVSDARNVVNKQPLFMFFLLEEYLQSVADIEDPKRLRLSAKDWYVLKTLGRHALPGRIEIVVRTTRDDAPAHQGPDGRFYYSRAGQMANEIGLADDPCGLPILVAYDEEPDMRIG